jgi:hypothetical protein
MQRFCHALAHQALHSVLAGHGIRDASVVELMPHGTLNATIHDQTLLDVAVEARDYVAARDLIIAGAARGRHACQAAHVRAQSDGAGACSASSRRLEGEGEGEGIEPVLSEASDARRGDGDATAVGKHVLVIGGTQFMGRSSVSVRAWVDHDHQHDDDVVVDHDLVGGLVVLAMARVRASGTVLARHSGIQVLDSCRIGTSCQLLMYQYSQLLMYEYSHSRLINVACWYMPLPY